jgi:hypothetical protein
LISLTTAVTISLEMMMVATMLPRNPIVDAP